VFGPAGTRERMGLIHGPRGDDGLMKRFTFETLTPGSASIGPFEVTAAHMNHPVEAFGFRFACGGRTVAYSGDTGETTELVPLARGVDAFLCEAAFLDGPDLPPDLHLSARQAAGYAARAGVGHAVLTHIQPWNDPEKALSQAAAAYDGQLSLARAGQVIDLGR
jgi:ribonuclease BN (tRNA processing enzyme)